MAGEADGIAMQGPHESTDMYMNEEHILGYTPTSEIPYQTANNDSGTKFQWERIETSISGFKLHLYVSNKRYCKSYHKYRLQYVSLSITVFKKN